MKKRPIHSRKELKEKRAELRHKLTPAEAFLWKHIKAKQLKGRRFNRQHSISNYIVDFYCASEKLIVELDGEVHKNPSAEVYDNTRTRYLESLGFVVVRFENRMVFDNLTSVLKEIEEHFKLDE